MAKRVTLTNQGLSLLASSSEATGQYYWLGYYALAYVPNLWKNDEVSIPADDCGNVNSDSTGSVEITETDTDQVTPTMTRLTKYGDMIYNVWQGDLSGTGYMGCSSDGSAGGDLFALTLYNTNVKKHYRYVLDENGNNTLVGWIEDPSYSDGTMLGKHVFKGTDGYFSSTLPIPAPVYYLGDVTGKVSVDSFFNELPTFEDTSGYNGNGADLYPFITVTLKATGNPTLDIPRVSADYRGYTDSQGNPGTFNYGGTSPFDTPITAPGTYFDSTEIPYPLDPINLQFDETSWFAADQTFNVSGSTATDAIFSEEFWKLHTISNYNRYHAPVDSIGHVLNSDLSNRNMAKTTKFFPISNYKVINSESGFTSNSEAVEVATAIKLSIDVDITPRTLNQGFDDDCQFDEDSNIEFFNQYGKAIHPSDAIDEYGKNIYESTHTSFKFNRIGIYAVPLRKAPYVQDQGFGTTSNGENIELEFQINPDDEPVLFAVLDWDNTISMSDTGDGINQFRAEVDVNLESPIGVDDTALLRNTTIFYNMYEDDALHWYQNQLIATASTSNAITEIGLEVAHIKNTASESNCCPSPDLSSKYAPMNHSHDFLRNLKDGNNALENGLKGIITAVEGSIIDSQTYTLGNASMVLGENTAVLSDRSIVGNGLENYIFDDSDESGILTGFQNNIKSNSPRSAMLAGQENSINTYASRTLIGVGRLNTIGDAEDSAIIAAVNSRIKGSNSAEVVSKSFIGAGEINVIGGELESSAIAAGIDNNITHGSFGFIGAGGANSISQSDYIFVGTGKNNTVTDSSISFIGSGEDNSLTETIYAFIGAGYTNVNNGADFGFIGAGASHLLEGDAHYSGIVAGTSNYIGINAQYSLVGAGAGNEIYAVDPGPEYTPIGIAYSCIGAGTSSHIEASYSMIGAGTNNRIDNVSSYSMIGAGANNYIGISGAYSFIGSGTDNTAGSTYTGIVAGTNNYIGRFSVYSFIGAGAANFIGSDIAGDTFVSPVAYASIVGGAGGKILEGADFGTILGGRDTVLDKKCEVGFSAGAFMSDDPTPEVLAYNKNSRVMLRGVTTTAEPTTHLSFENDGSQDFQIKRGEGFSGTINIMGYMQNVFTPDSCSLNDYRTMDVVYNELHSISGVYTKETITDVVQTTAISGLSYNEYDRFNENAVTGDGYNIDSINVTGFTSAATPGVTTPVTVTVTAATGGHGLVANDTITVWGSSDPAYNVLTPTPIVYVSSTIFTYQVLGPISDQNPTNSGTPGTFPTVNKIYYGPREIEHAPSIVDTVLDYRYTVNPGNNCQFGSAISDWVQSGYPKISMGVGAGGTGDTIAFLVDANPLHTVEQTRGEDTYVLVDGPIYWVATLDLTWIQIQ